MTDFGIARSLDVKGGLTQTGTVMGTSDYIAPEQARGSRVDAQSDIYSLGVVLYELLTGEVPFPGDNFVAVAMRHINEPPPSVRERRPDVSPRLDAAIRRAMAKEPRDRFASMDELCAELERLPRPGDAATSGARRWSSAAAPAARQRAPRPPAAAEHLAVDPAARRADGAGRDPRGASSRSPTRAASSRRSSARRRRPAPRPRRSSSPGSSAYDPFGDQTEHDDARPARDRRQPGHLLERPSTTTAACQAGRRPRARRGLREAADAARRPTDTPGFTAKIEAGSSRRPGRSRRSRARSRSGATRRSRSRTARPAVLRRLDHRPRLELLGPRQRGDGARS